MNALMRNAHGGAAMFGGRPLTFSQIPELRRFSIGSICTSLRGSYQVATLNGTGHHGHNRRRE